MLKLLCLGLVACSVAMKNVVFFVADDLRPQLNRAYGKEFMVTPHLDKFADESLVFDWAYTNFGICSASRNSFMTGRAPDKTRVWNFINHFRQGGLSDGKKGENWVTLPEFFKNAGYTTLGHGKLYHPNKPPRWDEPRSWSQDQPYVNPTTNGCQREGKMARFCPVDSNDAKMFSDYNSTVKAIATLHTMAKRADTPFFLGVGVHFPHQSWRTPRWAIDAYPPATHLQGAKHPSSPLHVPDIAFTSELDGVDGLGLDMDLPLFNKTRDSGIPPSAKGFMHFPNPTPGNNTVPTWFEQELRLGYYSAVTLTDSHFGMVMDALESLGLTNDTLVVFTGDHGWQLGEHAEWGKHTNFELATHVPLLIRAPWHPQSAGKHTSSVVELLDLYRTVASAAGLTAPAEDVDGRDMSALLEDPSKVLGTEAYSQYSRCPGKRYWPKVIPDAPGYVMNNCEGVPAKDIDSMGYSVRTAEYRFTEWYVWDKAHCIAKFNTPPIGTELYSHVGHTDPGNFDDFENENVAADAKNAQIVEQHRALLLKRFKKPGLGCPPDPSGEDAMPSLENA